MKFWKTLFVMFFLYVFFVLFAENSVILDIRVEGTNNVDIDLIKAAITFDIGETVNSEDIAQSIKNLYQLSIFKDIEINSEELRQGVAVIIKLEELPIVDKLTFKGNKKIDDEDIEDLITLKVGSFWSPYIKQETIRRIKKEYAEKGYLATKVSYSIREIDKNKLSVILKIDEGEKIKIKSIKIIGNEKIATKKILRKMKKTKEKFLFFISGKFNQKEFENDLNNIVNYYNKKGFIDAKIISHEVEQVEDKYIYITIEINEGQQYKFGSVSFSGNKRFDDETLKSNFSFKKNAVFNKDKFERQLANLSMMYFEEGFIYFRPDPVYNKENDVINVDIELVENTRAKVRKIKIQGNRKTKEKIIRRQLVLHPGQYFKRSKVVESQRNIYNLGFFEPNIIPDYHPINENGDVDLIISLQDKTSGTANGGIGYNSQDKVVGQFSISHNNLFGNSWRSSLKWEFSGQTQNVNLEFTNPYVFDSSILAGFNVYYMKKEYDSSNYEVNTRGGGFQLGKSVDFLDYSRIIGSYSLYTKKYSIMDSNEEISETLAEYDSKGWQYSSSVSLTLSRDSRDNVFFPTTGAQFTVFTELAGGPFGGDFDYFKQIFQTSWYNKLYWDFVLRTKWRFGYVTKYSDSESVPLDERFYLGGTGNDGIRGYPNRSVAPIDGGHRAIIFSCEIGYPIMKDTVIGLLFFDAGDSYNSLEEYDFYDMRKGAGLGIRVRSPFGIIGFDYAHNFEDNSWEPHLQIGTTF